MRNITQRKFIILYNVLLLIAIEIFMILLISISEENASLTTIILTIFLTPILGNMLVMSTVKKYIGICTENNFNKVFLIGNVVVYIFAYLFALKFNIVLVSVYTIGAVIGHLISVKIIKRIKNKDAEKRKR